MTSLCADSEIFRIFFLIIICQMTAAHKLFVKSEEALKSNIDFL